ncbi:MAG: deoxyribose-phosphate aldolase [Eudoraea sp.]|nr:deoxyribose-phosphate aldolase [Eudoraea sp.]
MKLAKYIDHTLLKPTATRSDILALCSEARKHQFYAVCVNGCHVKEANSALIDSGVKLSAVIGFPLGAMATVSKVAEAKYCIAQGADEIDMVINIGWLKEGLHEKVREEIALIKKTLSNKVLKVIIETCYLTDKEKRLACDLVVQAKADFVKTSTGFGPGGASPEDVQLIKSAVNGKAKIKASGGIKDRSTAIRYIEMGVARLGTSSGIKIIS